jgi:hypothetical protein
MHSSNLDQKKAQAILAGIRDSVSKLSVSDIQQITEPQLDRLDSWRCSLVFTVDATQATPQLVAELTYGGKRYKKPL